MNSTGAVEANNALSMSIPASIEKDISLSEEIRKVLSKIGSEKAPSPNSLDDDDHEMLKKLLEKIEQDYEIHPDSVFRTQLDKQKKTVRKLLDGKDVKAPELRSLRRFFSLILFHTDKDLNKVTERILKLIRAKLKNKEVSPDEETALKKALEQLDTEFDVAQIVMVSSPSIAIPLGAKDSEKRKLSYGGILSDVIEFLEVLRDLTRENLEHEKLKSRKKELKAAIKKFNKDIESLETHKKSAGRDRLYLAWTYFNHSLKIVGLILSLL